jgi:hypothetical protein
MPAPPASLPSGIGNFMKRNAKFAYGGLIGGLFLASDVKGIFDADNKLKALLKTLKDFVLIRVAVAGVFAAVASAVRALVRDTGSLDAALKKLGQMQVFSRQMQTFVGGLQAARQRVSELAVLSERGPFKFEELVEANKNLQVFTRGAYSSVQATKDVGEAAIATGNSVEDVSRAVGAFYDRLRSGQPVGDVAEQLRQLGVINQSTADSLTSMADSGASLTVVFGRLTQAIKQTAEGAAGYKTELQSVTEEHQKAIDALKAKFAAPWTADEAKNLTNYTEATKAFTPTVEALGKTFATAYTGFSTATSGMVKFAAQSKTVQAAAQMAGKAIVVLSIVTLAYGVKVAAEVIPALIALALRLTAVGTVASTAGGVLAGLGAIAFGGALLAGVATVIGAFIRLRQQIAENAKAYKDWVDKQASAQADFAGIVAAVTTLTEKNEAYAKGLERINALEKERADASKKQKETAKEIQKNTFLPGGVIPSVERWYQRFAGKRQEEDQQRRMAKQSERNKRDTMDQMSALSKQVTVNKELVDSEAQRRIEIEQSTKSVEQRDREARSGLQARQTYERDIAGIEGERQDQENKLIQLKQDYEKSAKKPEDTARFQRESAKLEYGITDAMRRRNEMAARAPEFSSVALDAEVDRLEHAKQAKILEDERNKLIERGGASERRRELNAKITRERTLAEGKEYTEESFLEAKRRAEEAHRREARAPGPEAVRAQKVQEVQIQTELNAHRARRRGDIATAQMQEDIASFVQNFEQLRPTLGAEKGARVALEKTADDIAQQYMDSQRVVSSMTAIGGGGGVSGVNAQLESDRRREQLLKEIKDILAGKATEENPLPGLATYGP